MKCPKCDHSSWRVANTVSSHLADRQRQHLAAMVPKAVTWYTPDFVVRHRFCSRCEYSSVTIEIEKKDLSRILEETKKGTPSLLRLIL